MKRIILTAFIVVITMASSNAQQFGVKAGLNLATITGDFTDDVDGRASLHFGVVAEFKISDVFSFQPELIYSSQGAKETYYYDYNEYDEDVYKLDYLNIPLMAKFYVAKGFSLEAGPQIGFLLAAKDKYVEYYNGDTFSGTEDMIDYMKTIDFGLNFGVGYKLDNNLNFGARYNLGLSDIWDDSEGGIFNQKNGVFQISVGYFFQ